MRTKCEQIFAGQNFFKSYEDIFGAKIIVILLHNQCIIMLILKTMDLATLASEINCVFYRSLHQDGKEHRLYMGGHVQILADFFHYYYYF